MIPKVLINWTYPLSDQTGFLLQRRKSLSGAWTLDIATDGSTLDYTDNDVVVGDTCSYHVAATNTYGTGAFSSTGSVYITPNGPITLFLTTDASPDVKPFDGTTSSSILPVVTPDITVFGDSHDLTQSFDEKLVGKRILSVTAGSITSGSGNTYIVVTSNTNTGSITGPPTGSLLNNYIGMPADTDFPFDDEWFTDTGMIASSGSYFMAVAGLPVQGVNAIVTSSNCISWSILPGVTSSVYPTVIAYNRTGTRIVGIDDMGGTVQYSDDNGYTWNTTPYSTTTIVLDIIHDGTRFVTVGQHSTVVTSSNGIDWGVVFIGSTDENWQRIVYNSESGLYVVAATTRWRGGPVEVQGSIYTSIDLINWATGSQTIVPGTSGCLGIAYSPLLGIYVAVGGSGFVATSSNGTNWMTMTSSIPPIYESSLSSIAWNSVDNEFAVSDFGSYIYNSNDGINWTLNTIYPTVLYHGSNYSYIQRLTHFPSINKYVVFGSGPPV